MMMSIINTIVARTAKQVVSMYRIGYYTTLDAAVEMVYAELAKQNVRLIADYDDYIREAIENKIGKYLLKN